MVRVSAPGCEPVGRQIKTIFGDLPIPAIIDAIEHELRERAANFIVQFLGSCALLERFGLPMRKPRERPDIPPRNSDNNKRRLASEVAPDQIAKLRGTVNYKGSSKHKRNPTIFGLEAFWGDRGDATLCDGHANFQPADMAAISTMIDRGLRAGLIGTNLWAVASNGWIFEGRLTNSAQSEYHGYPVRPTEAIAEPVYRRFKAWADVNGNDADKRAAENCASFYGFRDA